MRDLCTCPARHSGDYRDVRDHCTRYFLPYGWAYEEEGEHRSLILKGRCMCCGGEIWAAMPVPNCFQLGEIYYFLFQQLKTWRPYAMRGDPGEYPAANDRMAWYQLQDERSDLDWVLLLKKFLPAESHDIAMWFSGYQGRRSLFDEGGWPVGSVVRFKHECNTAAFPMGETGKIGYITIRPFQEMKVTSVSFQSGQNSYCGLAKMDNGRLCRLKAIPGDKLYSMDEWSALLPERLAQGSVFVERQDFEKPYPPEPAERLFALKRVSDTAKGVQAHCMAVSSYPALLKDMILQDVEKHRKQDLLPPDGTSGSVENLSGSKNQYTYRWTMSNEDGEYLCYTIESVPLLSEKIPLPEGGEI